MNVEEQEKRLLDYKWHERRYSKDTCYILSTQGTEEPIIFFCNTYLLSRNRHESHFRLLPCQPPYIGFFTS